MTLRAIGKIATLAGVVALALDTLSGGFLSGTLAWLWCGGAYLAPIDGVVGPGACGFAANLYLMALAMFVAMCGALAWAFGFLKEREEA